MAVFVEDSFTGVDGAGLGSHTGETNATWGQHPSYSVVTEIISNRARTGTSTGSTAYFNGHASGNPPTADYEVSAPVYQNAALNASSSAGPCGRMNAAANTFYHARFAGASSGVFQLFKFAAGVATQLGSDVAGTIGIGSSKVVTVRMVGDQISLLVDGVVTIGPITDSAITAAGEVGWRLTRQELHLASISADDDLTASVGRSLALPWTVTGAVGRSLGVSWGIKAEVGRSRSLSWMNVGRGWIAQAGRASSSTNSISSIDVPITRDVPKGHTLIATVGTNVGRVASITSNRVGNEWSLDAEALRLSIYSGAVLSCPVFTSYQTGDVVTVHFEEPTTRPTSVTIEEFAGLLTSGARVDRVATAGANSTRAEVTAAGAIEDDELVFVGVVVAHQPTEAFTHDAGWSALASEGATGFTTAASRTIHPVYQEPATTAAPVYGGTIPATRQLVAMMVTYRSSGLNPVGRSLTVPWNIAGPVGRALALPWAKQALVGKGLVIVYAIAGAVGRRAWVRPNRRRRSGARRFRDLRINGKVGKALPLLYRVGGVGVGRTLAISYHKDISISKTLALPWLLTPSAAEFASVHHVDPDIGDDSRSAATASSVFSPWRTMERAYQAAPSGSLVYALEGAYTDASAAPPYLTGSSSRVASATFRPYPGQAPVISGVVPPSSTARVTYIRFEDLEFKRGFQARGSQMEFVRCRIYHAPQTPRQFYTEANYPAGHPELIGTEIPKTGYGGIAINIMSATTTATPVSSDWLIDSCDIGGGTGPGGFGTRWAVNFQQGDPAKMNFGLRIRNTDMHDLQFLGVRCGGFAGSTRGATPGVEITNSTIRNIPRTYRLQPISGVRDGDDHVDIIHVYTAGTVASGLKIDGLLVLDCNALFHIKDGKLNDMLLANSVFARQLEGAQALSWYDGDDWRVVNNTLASTVALKGATSPTNFVAYNNYFERISQESPTNFLFKGYNMYGTTGFGNVPLAATDFTGTPVFTNPSANDYSLAAGSPGLARGIMSGGGQNAPVTDRLGFPRPSPVSSAPDIGAHERQL